MWQQFAGSDINSVKESLYVPDKLHLSTEGYKVWAQTMDPLFKQILAEK